MCVGREYKSSSAENIESVIRVWLERDGRETEIRELEMHSDQLLTVGV